MTSQTTSTPRASVPQVCTPAETSASRTQPSEDNQLPPSVLIVEDDLVRSSQLQTLAKEEGWTTLVAMTIEKAIEITKANYQRIHLALIDDMLPAYEDDLTILRELEQERERLSVRIREVHAETETPEPEIRRLQEDLAGLDSTWRSLIVEDGGLLFLEEAAKAGWLDHWDYAILSATDRVAGENAMDDWGIPKPGRYLGWLQKPVDVERIRSILAKSKPASASGIC